MASDTSPAGRTLGAFKLDRLLQPTVDLEIPSIPAANGTFGHATDMFSTVTLTINGITIGSQAYTPNGGPQPLFWKIGTNAALYYLTSAAFKLSFTGGVDAPNNNTGPEWSKADGAFVSFTGSVTPVPEPSQGVLALVGLGLAVLRRRRT
ncbi:MAG: PEP-CTERM sorting domain-containing protein [Verrucomicrobiales bacterium]